MQNEQAGARLTAAVLNATLRGEMVGTGTLIDEQTVLMPREAIRSTRDRFQVDFDEPNVNIAATVRNVDPQFHVVLLDLATPREITVTKSIELGAPCSASWFTNDHVRHEAHGQVTSVEEYEFIIELDVSSVVRGGAVIIDGALAGVLNVEAGGSFRVLSIHTIRRALARFLRPLVGVSDAPDESSESDADAPFDLATLVGRMTPTARRAMGIAEAIRRIAKESEAVHRHLHTQPLVVGLMDSSPAVANLLAKKNIARDRVLAEMQRSAKTEFPERVDPVDAASIAEPSKHLQRALVIAARAARDRVDAIHLLHGILAVAECSTQRALVALGLVPSDIRFSPATQISGFQADDARGEDLFDLHSEVRVLCSVLAAKDNKPPISVGLFGDWGSGKSFFMRLMEKELNDIAGKNDPKFCNQIVQLWFNAWHYSDANLWASLTWEIFNGLDRELHLRKGKGAPSDEEREQADVQRAKALKDLVDAKAQQVANEAALQKAEEKLREAEALLRTAEDAQTAEKSLHFRTIVRAAPQVLLEDATVKEKVSAAKKEISDAAVAAGLDAKEIASLRPTIAQAKALLVELRRKGNWWRVVTLLFIAVGAVIVARRINWNAIIAFATALGGVAAVLWTPVKKVLEIFRPALEAVHRLREALRKTADEQRQQAIANKTTAQANAEQARLAAQKAADLVIQKEKDIAENEPKRRFATFVERRRESDDYRKQLGVIALAHNDFRELSALFENAANTSDGTDAIQRIVLYIDDLDRCPENKVMDVLQAVHLLLAFPLFVVVVGVDARWLLHSLRQHSKAFASAPDQETDPEWAHWRSTPLNYLEKIFQIPITLRPMQPAGFGELVKRLVARKEKQETSRQPVTKSGGRSIAPPPPPDSTPDREGGITRDFVDPKSGTRPAERSAAEFLEISSQEGEFMTKLYPLMPSPRAAKRFVNVYLLIRGKRQADEIDDFVAGSDYEPLLLLLAILTGYPIEATYLLEGLMDGTPKTTWQAFLNGQKMPDDDVFDDWQPAKWKELKEVLAAVHEACGMNSACDAQPFVSWAPEVARYSFHSARIART